MQFVQSFWSKPIFESTYKGDWNHRFFGGFPNKFLFFCAWTYSCLTIKKYYPNLHLVTDQLGITLFRDSLQLPYQSFSTELDNLNGYHHGLWALGKLYTYRSRSTPFCHLDGDVFLFGKVLDSLLIHPLFCQSYDYNSAQYAEIHPYVHKHFKSVPQDFNANDISTTRLYNVGVIGGTDLKLIHYYCDKAFELIDHNQENLDAMNIGLLNLYYEQFLLSNIAKNRGIEAKTIYGDLNNSNNHVLGAFHRPRQVQFIHLISHLKKSTALLEQLVVRLQLEFPEFYARIINLYPEEQNANT